jgi:hypothetical protein
MCGSQEEPMALKLPVFKNYWTILGADREVSVVII